MGTSISIIAHELAKEIRLKIILYSDRKDRIGMQMIDGRLDRQWEDDRREKIF